MNIAQELLGATAVIVLKHTDQHDILAMSVGASHLDSAVLRAAASIEPTDLSAYRRDTVFHGVPLGTPPPFDRAMSILVRGDEPDAARVIIFPGKRGTECATLDRFATFSERRMVEIALMDRYRADLKRFVGMFNALERTAQVGLWDADLATRQVKISDQVGRIFDLDSRAPVPFSRALLAFSRTARRELLKALLKALRTNASDSVALPFQTAAGEARAVRIFIGSRAHMFGADRLAGVVQDVTEQQRATERLWWMANHDVLTELPNRALFGNRLQNALERRMRSRQLVVLVLVDVDKFKQVNDTYGHAAGDLLLKRVARQLRDTVRAHDTVARTGGDEFSILLEDIADVSSLESVLARLRKALDVRFSWDATTLDVSLSAGVAIAPEHGLNERDLTGAADLALYRSKAQPGAMLQLYQPVFGRAAAERNKTISAARTAALEGRIVPHYQPQIDLSSGHIVSVEALARWITPEGVLTAAQFHEALCDSDIGPIIGRSVMEQAMRDISVLNRGRTRKIGLSVNASLGDLLRENFLGGILALMEAADEPSPVTVEITEDVILDDTDHELGETMRKASEQGDISFALDDFGRGHGSLLHITALPISEVKIDRSFIAQLEVDEQKALVVQGIINVAHSLGVRVVVEGVETVAHATRISALGGQFVQGFHYSPAVPFDALRQLLRSQEEDDAAAA